MSSILSNEQIEALHHPLRGIVKDFLCGKELEAGYNDQAAIQADYEADIAAEKAAIYPPQPAPEPEAEPEPEASL